ncbi:unnamed protein product [Cyprideis torosa]|uniref:N(6)-adenosine-methyltransferase non-catalytic subunit METTL14 n=1 Tax=Cyprideis torosa TaxID=163714 RepID=A0A7R8WBC8_9CRUS|nr:unnamed protein product [Cyprideis torosa]CAG0887221.1 unnamed protein product [Cyprideis torosa]
MATSDASYSEPDLSSDSITSGEISSGLGDWIATRKERSRKRKMLICKQLGVRNVEGLSRVLGAERRRRPSDGTILGDPLNESRGAGNASDSGPAQAVYTDSTMFLKGTHSFNPHNDYCQHFVDTGQRPQNFIRDVAVSERFEEYPKLKELIRLKDELISTTATPPMYLQCDPETYDLHSLGAQFDVILIEPPIQEGGNAASLGLRTGQKIWNWEKIAKLDIPAVSDYRSFVFMWCGSSEGLDHGRRCLRQWGFRRCEDICWIKTNIKNPGHSKNLEPKAIFQRTKEHCLMGIKGTVRRSTDGDFIHANVDIDLIITEEDSSNVDKPQEIFSIIERFCLGRRRLHIFGKDSTIRPGWLTIGPQLTHSNFNAVTYSGYFSNGSLTTGCTERIETLRPKSPPPKSRGSGGLFGSGGRSGGRAR